VKKALEIFIVSLIMTGLSFVSTFPLIKNFGSVIPWTAYRADLSRIALNHPGDHLQIVYFFWLVKENLLGRVPLNGNPYEFNMLGGLTGGNDGFTTAPLAFISFIFSPFGDIAAYNCTLILSYILAGVFMYLLARMITDLKSAALFLAVIFTFLPLRINSLAGGHQFGFVLFLYPLIFYYLEKCIKTRKMVYSFLAVLGIVALSFNEPHLIYYFFLFMGGYLPIRYLSQIPVNESLCSSRPVYNWRKIVSWPPLLSLLIIFGSGMAIVLFTHLVLPRQTDGTFFTIPFWYMIGYYPLILLFFSLMLATVYNHLSKGISLQHGLAIEAGSMLPLYLLSIIFILLKSEMLETKLVILCAIGGVVATKLWLLKKHLYGMVEYLWQHTIKMQNLLKAFSPALLGMVGVVVMNLMTKPKAIASSTESGGRTLNDVRIYSAHLQDLFKPTSSLYLGWLPISFGIIFLCYMLYRIGSNKNINKTSSPNLPVYALLAVTLLLSHALALGLALGNRSLYILFFNYVPFFNVPRISERILSITVLILACIIAGIAQTIIRRFHSQVWIACCSMFFVFLTVVQLKSYMVTTPMAMTDLQQIEPAYQYIKENIGDDVLLELPLWYGDSHQSSVYEYYTTLDKIKRVNGYTPLVSQEYIRTVFNPLHSMNSGGLKLEQYNLLRRLNVKFITVHENRAIFTAKVSPHPPFTTVRRLSNSPYLDYIGIEDIIHKRYNSVNDRLHIFRVKENVSVTDEAVFYTTARVYRAGKGLYHQTGQIVLDKTLNRKVFNAVPGRDKLGFLVFGPFQSFFPGSYRCYFRLKYGGSNTGKPGARIEVVRSLKETQEVLVMTELSKSTAVQTYQDYYLDFEVSKRERLEFRVFFYGTNEISLDKIVVNRTENINVPDFLEAEMMVGETGRVVSVKNASGKKVIEAVPGLDKSGRIVYGSIVKLPKGHHSAIFHLKGGESSQSHNGENKTAAIISITGDQGDTVFAKTKVKTLNLSSDAFSKRKVDFVLHKEEEVGLEVFFTHKAVVQLDGVEIRKNSFKE